MKDRHIPKIRYSSFTGSWEKKSLLELMTFSNGINAPKESYGIGRRMISVMDILQEGPIVYEKIRNAVQVEDKIEQKNKVENGDLVFVRSSETVDEVGIAKAYSQRDYALFSGFTIRGKKKSNYDAKFIELSLNTTNRKQIERKAGGSTRFNVSQFLLNRIEIFQPSIEEQEKIGKFFNEVESTIALHQQELDILKQTKQGFLQKMFPKEGETVPVLRFPGFSGEWKEKKLGELVEKAVDNRGKTPPTISEGEYPLLEVASLGKGSPDYSKVTKYVSDNTYKNWFRAHIKKNDILFSTVGNTGLISLMDDFKGATIAQNIVAFRAVNANSAEFLATMLQLKENFRKSKRIEMGAVQPSIKVSQLVHVQYMVTENIHEQIKIGELFTQLDEVIKLHEKELELLKQTKKAFLQKMFV